MRSAALILTALLWLFCMERAAFGQTLTPTVTPTRTPTATISPTSTITRTWTTKPTRTVTHTVTQTKTLTVTQTRTRTATATKTATFFATPTPSVAEPTLTPFPTASPAASATNTPTPTPTYTGSPLAEHRIKWELIEFPTPYAGPSPAATPLCVMVSFSDNLIPKCIPISGPLGSLGGGQRKCVTTGSMAAGVTSNVCVTWDSPYSSGSVYDVFLSPLDTTTDLAAIRADHISSQSATQACAVVFNQDATNARTGTLCLVAFQH